MGNEEKMSRVYVPKKTALFIFIVFIASLSVVGYILFNAYGGSRLINPQEQLKPIGKLFSSSNKVQQIAGSKKNTNDVLTIIFFYDGYTSQKEAQVDAEIMQKALELVEPFKSLKDHVSYKVFTTDKKQCKVDSQSNYLVCDKELIKSFRALGTDNFKVVLMSQDSFTGVAEKARGKNSWLTIPTTPPNLTTQQRREWLGLNITRLLGYSLGLSYESGSASAVLNPSIPPEALAQKLTQDLRPNCAKDLESAKKLWGDYEKIFSNVSYFNGCGGDAQACGNGN